MSLGPKKCSKCEKTVYPVEEIIYLDKSWHKGCLKCTVCNTTLNIKSAKGYEKQPYCNVHYPQLKSTAIADNPELQRIRQLTDVQSNAKYRKDFNEDRDALMKPYTPRICSVCNEKKEWCAFKNVNISGCQHEIRFVCNECLLQHVCIAIQQTFRDDIFCLEENCGVKFDYQSVKNILSLANDKQLLERYDRGLEQMNGFIHCSNPACGVEQLNEGGQSNPIVICYRCHQKTCFIHRIQWHEGMTCEEYDEQVDPGDEPSRQWIATHTKQCPKCPWQIEKNEGCDHMTCIKCKHEFCWSCLADYQLIKTEGHRRHRDTCQHYRRVA